MMEKAGILDGKKVLIVDDEADVLETLEDLLPMCDIVTASSYEEASQHLQSQWFDIAILDIMGVSGYELLEICARKGITAVMLTAHALSQDHVKKSYTKGAAYYIPKEEMAELEEFIVDVLVAKEKGENTWAGWYQRFIRFFERKFDKAWRDEDKDFLNKISYY
jgi:CheY-like chemotaxis protein